MCGRFVLKQRINGSFTEEVVKWRELHALLAGFNIAPSQIVPVLVNLNGRIEAVEAVWGFVSPFASDLRSGGLINARAETVNVKPTFGEAFRRRRCIVPADGWYEWQKRGRSKQPYYIHGREGQLLGFAGIWQPNQANVPTVAVLTTAANAAVEVIHDRMPAVLPRNSWDVWLHGDTPVETLKSLLVPAASELFEAYPVSTRVNKPSVNDSACIERIAEPTEDAGLFG